MNRGNEDLWPPFEDHKRKYLEIPLPSELDFDDNDLSSLIYNEPPPDSSQSVRDKARQFIIAIQNDSPVAVNYAWNLLEEQHIPLDVYRQISSFLARLPMLPRDKLPCSWFELHRRLWVIGMSFDDDYMRSAVGHELQLYYERIQNAKEYRKVNEVLKRIAIRQYRGLQEEAVRESNIGFSYMMEGNWKDARTYFEKAALIMENVNELEYYNIRLNIVISRFGERGWVYDEDFWNAVTTIGEYLKARNDWRERKSLVCRARVKEKSENLEEAIELMKQTVRIGEAINDMYLEHDRSYLSELENTRPD